MNAAPATAERKGCSNEGKCHAKNETETPADPVGIGQRAHARGLDPERGRRLPSPAEDGRSALGSRAGPTGSAGRPRMAISPDCHPRLAEQGYWETIEQGCLDEAGRRVER